MTEEFYDSAYLQKTGLLAQSMKEASYESFKCLRDSTIVDLGCGSGEDVYRLSKLLDSSNSIIGADHNAILLNEAKSKNNARPNCQFIQTEAHQLPFANNSVNALRTERMFQRWKLTEFYAIEEKFAYWKAIGRVFPFTTKIQKSKKRFVSISHKKK